MPTSWSFSGVSLGPLVLQGSVMKAAMWYRDYCCSISLPAMALLMQTESQGCVTLSPSELWGHPNPTTPSGGHERCWGLTMRQDNGCGNGPTAHLHRAGERQWSPGVGLIHLLSSSTTGKILGMKTATPQANFRFFKTEIQTLCNK